MSARRWTWLRFEVVVTEVDTYFLVELSSSDLLVSAKAYCTQKGLGFPLLTVCSVLLCTLLGSLLKMFVPMKVAIAVLWPAPHSTGIGYPPNQ